MRRMTKYQLLSFITPLIVILDQLTKWLVVKHVLMGERISVIPGFFDLVHFRNQGAAFGLFAAMNASWRGPFFFAVAAVALAVLAVSFVALPSRDRLTASSLALIFGGIIGNVIDRCRFGEVVDFLSWHFRNESVDWTVLGQHISFALEWPAFNVADSAITVAMILLVLSTLKKSEH